MNKRLILFFLLLSIFIAYTTNFDNFLKFRLSKFNINIQDIYVDFLVKAQDRLDQYSNQAKHIEELKSQIKQNQKYKALYKIELTKNQELLQVLKLKQEHKVDFQLVRVLSYIDLKDKTKVILNNLDLPLDKIYPLVSLDGFSSAIALKQNNKTIALLNQNKKCNYTVFIGEKQISGITSGATRDNKMLIRFIPIWKHINIGDEVITSGMDKIFPYGIKVGKVLSIKSKENTQEVLIKPYATTLNTRYFYIIK
jgi:rod shape-determining protein MreC